MTAEEIFKESNDLKREILAVEMRMGEKKAWANVEGKSEEYLKWVVRTKTFYRRLMVRYAVIKVVLRENNRRKYIPR